MTFLLSFLPSCSGGTQASPTQATMKAPPPRIVSTRSSAPAFDCDQPSQVQTFEMESELLNDQLRFSVYFPPCHDKSGVNTYPTIYLLHGQTYDNRQWQRLGIAAYADELIQSGRVLPFLIVMPYEKYHYRSPTNNQFPLVIVQELLPWVESELHGRAGRDWRAIGGISRGASWAVRMGLQDTETFGAVGAHSLPTFNADVDDLPNWLEAISDGESPRIYIDTGRSDPEVDTAAEFVQILNLYGIPNEWHLNNGRHDETYWSAHVQEYLDWYTLPWRIKPSA